MTLEGPAPIHICGVDEVGRGPLAGPVVAAAVILRKGRIPRGLNDSKKLRSLSTAAVNLRAEDGAVTAVELLSTPKADESGLPEKPQLLARWPK